MIPEILNDPNVGNLLRGASIILAVEPKVSLAEALNRSKIAEERSEADLDKARELILKARVALTLNGEKEPDYAQARAILKHMLKDPPWNRISNKHELP